ncbi:MAG: hypothetical protein JRI57_02780 [Deltaproteobacteria bacterium]|nr:hypothetical protein [Deltaproteobacteria bacterium]MBW1953959.1 hypothetical protein [Deltaproteobacteria bacterium]MBW1986924.1 hypothetical protein [Deltaproteobacteria bacterium]MBW2134087.1 hypothetical protein [Deltaproteobacteria bacterium]
MKDQQEIKGPLICLTCAWRETCQKKFSFTGTYCSDYTRDVSVKEPVSEDKTVESPEKK